MVDLDTCFTERRQIMRHVSDCDTVREVAERVAEAVCGENLRAVLTGKTRVGGPRLNEAGAERSPRRLPG